MEFPGEKNIFSTIETVVVIFGKNSGGRRRGHRR